MKIGIAFASALLGVVALSGASTAEAATEGAVDWRTTPPLSGRVSGDFAVVRTHLKARTFALAVLDEPSIDGDYAVTGRVLYTGAQSGYVEMWSVFQGGGRYFSRSTLDRSNRRPTFELPFSLAGGPPPVRLEINVVLPPGSRAILGPLRLGPYEPAPEGWWDDRTGSLVGGIAGSALGLLGGLTGFLVSRRRARAAVTAGTTIAAIAGGGVLVAGVVAVVASQPYGVWYPLVLLGGLLLVVGLAIGRAARRAYTEAELRKMRALDSA